MTKVTLTKIWIDTKPTQYGSFKTNIKCTEYGDRWISGFAKEFKYKEGDIVEIDVFENEKGVKDKDGNVYLNWKFPNKDEQGKLEISQIKFSLAKHDSQIKDLINYLKKKFPTDFGIRTEPPIPFTPETLENPEKAKEQFQKAVKESEEEFNRKFSKDEDINSELSLVAEEDLDKVYEEM